MPEHLRALIVILVLASAVFAFAKAPACAVACTRVDFERRRNLWFGVTFAAFLAHNFWIFIAIAAVLLLFALPLHAAVCVAGPATRRPRPSVPRSLQPYVVRSLCAPDSLAYRMRSA